MASQPDSNHYQTLGISRNAKITDINRAYNKLVKASQRDDVAPDARRDERIKNAYDTLSDEAKREAYDQTLVVRKAKTGGKLIGSVAVGTLLVVAAGTWYLNKPAAVPAKAVKPVAQLRTEILRSIARVQSISVSGQTTAVGMAFAIEKGVMGTPCEGLTPGAQITLDLGDRNVPARLLDRDDASGYCKLAADNAASWPMPLSRTGPKLGEAVYVALPAEGGLATLRDATVTHIGTDPAARYYDTSVALTPGAQGGPLVDATGRAVGIARAMGGTVRFIPLPAAWFEEKVELPKEPPRNIEVPAQDDAKGEPGAVKPEAPAGTGAKKQYNPLEMDAKRKDELRKSFRPDPNVPADL